MNSGRLIHHYNHQHHHARQIDTNRMQCTEKENNSAVVMVTNWLQQIKEAKAALHCCLKPAYTHSVRWILNLSVFLFHTKLTPLLNMLLTVVCHYILSVFILIINSWPHKSTFCCISLCNCWQGQASKRGSLARESERKLASKNREQKHKWERRKRRCRQSWW